MIFVIQMWSKTCVGNDNTPLIKITYVIPYHKDITKKYVNRIFYDFLKEHDRIITVQEFIDTVIDTFDINSNRTYDATVRSRLTEEQILTYVCNHSMDTYRNYRTSEKLETCPDYLYEKVYSKNTLCTVCLYNIREGAQLYTCGCVYHVHCLKTSYGYSYLCPVCQIDMRDQRFVKDPEIQEIIV